VDTPPSRQISPLVLELLGRARDLGFLGPGPLDQQVVHALGFAAAVEAQDPGGPPPGSVLDLGSGGGLPGLLLVERWSEATATLLDAAERRTTFLAEGVRALGWSDRVTVVRERAEVAGHEIRLRGTFDLVVARSFGLPAVTAECAAPFLRPGGLLVVSEPPGSAAAPPRPLGPESGPGRESIRWPRDGVGIVGLEPVGEWRGQFGYRVLRQVRSCPDAYPRRVGIPAKRPLYRLPDA
jgi:16S rRNA (guanine527-N7)-methyltransferase